MKAKNSAVVVGGGISGLTSAYELAKLGYNVTILEKNSWVGGRLYPFVKDGFMADAGAQLIGEDYHNTLKLLDELGLRNELVKLSEPSAAMYSSGKIFLLNLSGLIRYNKLNFREKRNLFRLFRKVEKTGNAKRFTFTNIEEESSFDSISIAEWTVENFSEKILEYFVQPSLTALTLVEPEKLSAFYGLTLLYSDLKSSYTLKRGLSSMISILSQQLRNYGAEIKTNCEVKEIEVEDDHVCGVEYENDNGINRIETPNVICSTPAPISSKILPSPQTEVRSSLSKVKYSSGLQIILALNECVWGKTWAILIPRSELKDIAMVSESTLKCESFASKGRGLMEVYIYGAIADKLSKQDNAEISKFVIDNLENLFPKISEKVLWSEVLQWDHVIPINSPGFSKLRGEFTVSTKGLSLAGDYLYLPSIESAVYSGINAAKRIAENG